LRSWELLSLSIHFPNSMEPDDVSLSQCDECEDGCLLGYNARCPTYINRCETSGSDGGEYKVWVFWDVAPCSHVEVDRRFRGVYYLYHQSDRPLKRLSISTRLHRSTS
jgi:hypothetical protein